MTLAIADRKDGDVGRVFLISFRDGKQVSMNVATRLPFFGDKVYVKKLHANGGLYVSEWRRFNGFCSAGAALLVRTGGEIVSVQPLAIKSQFSNMSPNIFDPPDIAAGFNSEPLAPEVLLPADCFFEIIPYLIRIATAHHIAIILFRDWCLSHSRREIFENVYSTWTLSEVDHFELDTYLCEGE